MVTNSVVLFESAEIEQLCRTHCKIVGESVGVFLTGETKQRLDFVK